MKKIEVARKTFWVDGMPNEVVMYFEVSINYFATRCKAKYNLIFETSKYENKLPFEFVLIVRHENFIKRNYCSIDIFSFKHLCIELLFYKNNGFEIQNNVYGEIKEIISAFKI